MRTIALCVACAWAGLFVHSHALGQSVVERTPSLSGAWLAPPGVVQFNFVHRFRESGAPEHRISNSPTFVTAIGVPHLRAMLGAAYATNSDVVARMPNEWEFFLRAVPLSFGNRAVDLSVQVGYNQAAGSVDAEMGATGRVGRVRLLAAGRRFSNAFDAGAPRYAVAGGVVLRVNRYLAVAGDLAALHEHTEDERPAWSVGLQLGVPSTPHSLSLHVTNSTTGTLEGASRGGPPRRIGFEYTVPITLARYVRRFAPRPVGAVTDSAAAPTGRDTVLVHIQDFTFTPRRLEIAAGATIVWTNDGSVPHTVTADDGQAFDSGAIAGGGAKWTFQFVRPGTYAFHCDPHPFMQGVVVVR
jgi:plastocyanin